MRVEDLYPGLTVRIIDFSDNGGHRPDHWSDEGDMDDWQGEVVTIHSVEEESEYVSIEEDDGDWQWYPWDFEPHTNLSVNDPNVRYRLNKRMKKASSFWEEITKKKYKIS